VKVKVNSMLKEYCIRGHKMSETRVRNNGRHGSYCRECHRSNKWHKTHPLRAYENNRRSCLKRKYGLTVDQYEAKLKEQHGVCAVCEEPPRKQRLAVDHDHATNLLRDLLCSKCNLAVGLVADSPGLLDKVMRYLRKHSQLRLVG